LIQKLLQTKGEFMSKKKVLAVVITTFALTAGSIGVAGAASKSSQRVSVTKVAGQMGIASEQAMETLLKDLVAKGTITQAQADSVAAAIASAKAAVKENRKLGDKVREFKADGVEKQNLISGIIGLDTATIHSRLKAGESLALIAGAKKDALIAALVADHTKRIDAAVTAGTLTAVRATELKANVVAHVTAKVNEVGGKHGLNKGEKEGKDGHGRGHGGHGHKGGAKAPTLPTPATTTGA
jgi:polyhydroxyalkanoate synthesis regulator phasin